MLEHVAGPKNAIIWPADVLGEAMDGLLSGKGKWHIGRGVLKTDMLIAGCCENVADCTHRSLVGLAAKSSRIGLCDKPIPSRVLESPHLPQAPLPGLREHLEIGRINDDVEVLRVGKFDENGVTLERNILILEAAKIDPGPDRSPCDDDKAVVKVLPEAIACNGAQRRSGEGTRFGAGEDDLVVEAGGGEFAKGADARGNNRRAVYRKGFLLLGQAELKDNETRHDNNREKHKKRGDRQCDFLSFHALPLLFENHGNIGITHFGEDRAEKGLGIFFGLGQDAEGMDAPADLPFSLAKERVPLVHGEV